MLTTFLVLRLVKWLGVALLTGGLAVSVGTGRPRARLVGALGVATLGLVVSWLAGYGMLKATGGELSAPWVNASLFASMAALGGGVLGGLTRSRALPLALVTGGLAASLGLMTGRVDPVAMGVLGGIVPAVLAIVAGLVGFFLLPAAPVQPQASSRAVLRWFTWIARAEGVSLLVLFGVYMPLKYGVGIEIDGGQGWIGWIHGMLVFLYLLALGVGVFANRWGILAGVLGFFASLLPFGTFVFEWWLHRRQARRRAEVTAAA